MTAKVYADKEDSPLVAKAKKEETELVPYEYTERDVILYNLGVGATETELQWTYEGDEDFAAIPTFGVIPQFLASSGVPLDWLPDYNPVSTQKYGRNRADMSQGKTTAWRAVSQYQGPHSH